MTVATTADVATLAAFAAFVAIIAAVAALRPPPRRIDVPAAAPDTGVVGSSPAPTPAPLDVALAAWRRRRSLRRPPSPRAVAEWCDDIARLVRSGTSLRDALTCAASDDPGIERAVGTLRLALDRGVTVTEAVSRVDAPGRHLQLALSVIATAGRVGGPSAAAVDRTAMTLRRRASEIDDRSTHAAQARLSTHVMTAVPLLMLAVLTASDDDVRAVTMTPAGIASITAGLGLNMTGWWWMRRIVGAGR